jgi:CheY-like chemotaxis protein
MMFQTVLVIDDDSDVRDMIAALFEMHGWRTIQGESGDTAVALAVEHLPDLIVLDVMMPVMDGIEAFRELRTDPRTSHLPVIMLTAVNEYELSTPRDAERVGHEAKVNPPEAFLEKPVDARILGEVMEGLFPSW